jgi:hypothetical protein
MKKAMGLSNVASRIRRKAEKYQKSQGSQD